MAKLGSEFLSKLMMQMGGDKNPASRPAPPAHPVPPKTNKRAEIPPIVSAEEAAKISSLLTSRTMEVEASIGVFRETVDKEGRKKTFFVPGVTAQEFDSLRRFLEKDETRQFNFYDDTVESMSNHSAGNVRRKTDRLTGMVVYEIKKRFYDATIDNHLWGYRVSKSEERFVDEVKDFVPETIRQRKRFSFSDQRKASPTYGIQFDLTQIRERRKNKSGEEVEETKFEVEIERIKGARETGVAHFQAALLLIFLHLQDVPNEKMLMTLPERKKVIELHNHLFQWRSEVMLGGYWNKPQNIEIKDLLEPQFAVTLKLDGLRRFLLFTDQGTYSVYPPMDIRRVGPPHDELRGTLLDTEQYRRYREGSFIDETFYVFDILFDRGTDVRSQDLTSRLKRVSSIVPLIQLTFSKAKVKKFYTEGNFYQNVQSALEEADESPLGYDGIIFQPFNQYSNKQTRKWKPSSYMTVDLLFRREERDQYTPMTYSKGGLIPFQGSSELPYEGTVTVPSGKWEGIPVDGMIVECLYVTYPNGGGEFQPYRVRLDRSQPNNLETVLSVWKDIFHPITRATIEGRTLQVMRKFHNREKESLLEKNFGRGDRIVDVGSGRGGDLPKWTKRGLSKVWVIEPSEENLAIFEERRSSMRGGPQIEVLRGSSQQLLGIEDTKEILPLLREEKVSGIVSFFSLTFSTQTEAKFKKMIKTIDALLPEGGKLVGIVMDGSRVRDLLEDERWKNGTPEDEGAVYSGYSFAISQRSRFTDEVGGNEIEITIHDPQSMVKDQTEWLFYFDPFRRELEKRGIILQQTGFLDKGDIFDQLPPESQLFSSLNRYFVFVKGTPPTLPLVNPSDIPVYRSNPTPTSFFRAVLEGTRTEYRDSPVKNEYLRNYRQKISTQLEKKTFRSICQMSPVDTYPGKSTTEKWEAIRKSLTDPREEMDPQQLLPLLGKIEKVNIILLGEDLNLLPLRTFYQRWDVDRLMGDLYTEKRSILIQQTPHGFHLLMTGAPPIYRRKLRWEDPLLQMIMEKFDPIY